jgi:beta-glucosidase
MSVNGQFSHSAVDDRYRIKGASGREAAYREEIIGTRFELSIRDLEPGRYTVELGFVEVSAKAGGERVFDVTCGREIIATNLDLFASAGGAGQVLILTNAVEYSGDATNTPLTFTFSAGQGNAKFNTVELKDAGGRTIVTATANDFIGEVDVAAVKVPEISGPVLWKDPSWSTDERVKDLLRRMSLHEKSLQMLNGAPAIPRIGLPAYNYWNECLHGVGRAGIATVFPQAIGLAAMWDEPLMRDIADVIAVEARAKHHHHVLTNNGNSAQYFGLTFWTPNINIFRDPRWGRGHETYGEDPFLTARLGVAFIQGLQGDDPKYIKAMACAKHFAVHSGPEPDRHSFDAVPPERDFYDTYLPHFEAAVREGKVGAVMGAYNRVYGEPACSSTLLLDDLLRRQWGFNGHVVSDCGAIRDIYAFHKVAATTQEASARAVKAGCDLCCGGDYKSLWRAVGKGLISESEIDIALGRLLEARLRLGLFDPPEQVPFAQIPIEKNDCAEHAELALRAARESIVLLKNDGLLPLNRRKIKRIAVIGTNANSVTMLLGNYNGIPSRPITILDGIRSAVRTTVDVVYEPGCPLARKIEGEEELDSTAAERAVAAAREADVVIYVGGLSPDLEREEKKVNYEGFAGGDRTSIELPPAQTELIKALHATRKQVVFVNCSGSAVAFPWEAENLPAVVQAWYPGGPGGRAVAEVLFGDFNPAGRLPVTFYSSTTDLPPFEDYAMSNRTYRYFTGKPLFAFGHGLSYTSFKYSDARLDSGSVSSGKSVKVTVNVRNTGKRNGDEVVQVYLRHRKPLPGQPQLTLCGFSRVSIPRGTAKRVTVEIPLKQLRYWDVARKQYVVDPGDYELLIGPSSDKLPVRLTMAVK